MKRKIMYYTIVISCGLLMSGSIVYTQKVGKKTVPDYDGNIYHTVTIGKQTWMVENLKTTHYRNGDPITHAKDDDQWLKTTSGAYCNYDNDENNVTTYGRLYNRYAVTDSRGICPSGWHIPTSAEWKILESYLGGSKVAGGKMKEAGTAHWVNPNIGADNSSGFLGVPGGIRYNTGSFSGMRFTGYLWSSGWKSLGGSDAPWLRLVNYSAMSINSNDYSEATGFSVRCLKD